MSRGGGKRRLRVRRRRKGEGVGADAAEEVFEVAASSVAEGVDDGEIVGSFGCCVVEAVGSAGVLAAFLFVPAYLLLG